jgi:hypothetical protein
MPYFLIGSSMPGPWGPPPMMYLPCSPWAGWYGLWTPPPMHFCLGWPGPAGGFGHGGHDTGDGHYGGVSQQRTRQENWTVRNAKPDHPVPSKTIEAPWQLHKQSVRGSEDARRMGAVRVRKGQRVKLWPMTMKRSIAQRKVQRRLQQSKTRPKMRRPRSKPMQWPVSNCSQIG